VVLAMSSLAEVAPTVDFELDKSSNTYDEILEACEDVRNALTQYNEKYSFRSHETYMREHLPFGEYLESRKNFFEKSDATMRVTDENVDSLIEDMVEARENKGSNVNQTQAIAELRPFSTTRVDKTHAQIMREMVTGQKHLIRLDASALNRRHQPSKVMHRVRKAQLKLLEKEAELTAITQKLVQEAERLEEEALHVGDEPATEAEAEEGEGEKAGGVTFEEGVEDEEGEWNNDDA
jgi:hypothetical protein